MAKYLEDIVEEDIRGSTKLSLRVREFLKERLDNPLTRHPILTSAATFIAAERTLNLLSQKYPEAFYYDTDRDSLFFSSYSVYIFAGLIKEYVLEGRRFRKPLNFRNIYQWFLDNPKITGLIAATSGAIVSYKAKMSMYEWYYGIKDFFDLHLGRRIDVLGRTSIALILSGVLGELSTRGLKNLKKIKKSIRQTKTNIGEKIWNFTVEHPFLNSALITFGTFNYFYNKISQMHKERTQFKVAHSLGEYVVLKGNLLEDFKENLDILIEIGLVSSLLGVGTFVATLAAGSVLHTHSLRDHSLRLRKYYYDFIKKERAIEYQRKITKLPNSIERKIEDIVELGNMYYNQEDKENAFMQYRRALRLFEKKSDQISYVDFFRRIPSVNGLVRWYKRRRQTKTPEQKGINGMFIDLLNKDNKSLDYIKYLAEKDQDPTLIYIYGKVLEVLGYKESGRIQKKRAIELKLKSGVKLKIKTGSKNKIMEFDEPMLRKEVIAKQAPKSALEREIQATYRAKEILRDFDNYDVPTPIGIIEYDDAKYYVMEYASGDLLADRIRERKSTPQELCAAAEFMGILHAKLSTEGLGKRNYTENIVERLISVSVSNDIVRQIHDNLYAATKSLDYIIKVCNLDSHPRNRIIDEFGGIVGIDLELDRVVPLTIDTANLLDQHSEIDYEKKEELLQTHISSFQLYSDEERVVDREEYHLAYLNSVVIRALEIYSQVKIGYPKIKEDSLTNAQIAISKIKEKHTAYYEDYEHEYKELNKAVAALRSN